MCISTEQGIGRGGLWKKWGDGGLPPQKLITFDPFVNDMVNFFLFFSFFFSDWLFLWGAHTPSAYAPATEKYHIIGSQNGPLNLVHFFQLMTVSVHHLWLIARVYITSTCICNVSGLVDAVENNEALRLWESFQYIFFSILEGSKQELWCTKWFYVT